MGETRITLNPQVAQSAKELLQLTGVSNISNLFALLLTRYGQHLKNSWVIGVNSPQVPSMQAPSMQAPSMQYELPPCLEPLELPQAEDPTILRLSRLIEDF